MNSLKRAQQGFTIIELMIATSVFSVILIVISVMMINVGNLYYKGVNQARTQDNVRSIADDITSHLQLSNGRDADSEPGDTGYDRNATHYFCIGTTRYTFVFDKQLGTDSNHVLWRDTVAAGTCRTATPVNLSSPATDGTELVGSKSRLTDFTISSTEPYTVDIGVAYGDSDLLNVYDVAHNSIQHTSPNDTRCLGGPGQAYCATAFLTTAVTKRL